MYMGFVLYAPALALQAIAGWATYKTILVCGVLATAYTCKGGMKSVYVLIFRATFQFVWEAHDAMLCVHSRISSLNCVNVWKAHGGLIMGACVEPALEPAPLQCIRSIEFSQPGAAEKI